MTTATVDERATTMDVLESLVVDDAGRRWGQTAEPYQRVTAAAILDDSPAATPQHLVVQPKGGRKTSDAAGIALARMLTEAPLGARLYAAAKDREQAAYLIDSLREFRDRTPGLGGVVVTESKCILPNKNAELEALTADAGGAQGARPWHLVVDELAEWPDLRTQRKLLSTLLAGFEKQYRVDKRVRAVVLTNAGSPVSLAGKHYRMATASRFWQVHELVSPDGISSPLPWVTADDLERARENSETDATFRRLHLGFWDEGPDRLATLDDVEACAVLDGEQPPKYGTSYIVTADLSLRRDLCVLAVLHRGHAASGTAIDGESARPGGEPARLVVDVLRVWKPTRGADVDLLEVAAQAEDLARYYGAPVFLDSWQAAPLVQMLQRNGVRAELDHPTEAKNSRAVVSLMAMLRDRRIDLPNDPDLVQELATVPIVETRPNVFRVGDDRQGGSHHDRYSAIALGAMKLEDAAMQWAAAQLAQRAPVLMRASEYQRYEVLARMHRTLAEKGSPAAIRWFRSNPEPDYVLGRPTMPDSRRR